MPEIVEAQILVDGLMDLAGDRITHITKLADSNILKNEETLISELSGSYIVHIFRQGKRPCFVIYTGTECKILDIFLSMSGALMIDKRHKNSRVSIELESGRTLYYIDARKWGRLTLRTIDSFKKKFTDKSVDALDADYLELHRRLLETKDPSRSMKNVLMDQSVILGLGNVYAQEALYLAKIHPRTKLEDVSEDNLLELSKCIKSMLELSYEVGGLSLKDYVHVDGKLGSMFEEAFVYRKKNCRVCDSSINRISQGGRSTYYCPTCQIN